MKIPITQLKVFIKFDSKLPVGRLVIHEHTIYFAYDEEFLHRGIEISPFHLPLKSGLIRLPNRPFEGLSGVFGDCLPDGWGRILIDRWVRNQGVMPDELSTLDRLSFIGENSLGALLFEPDQSFDDNHGYLDLDHLAQQTAAVLSDTADYVLQELITLNGSSAGARPKALIGLSDDRQRIIHGSEAFSEEFTPWLVKFANKMDGNDAGVIEFIYSKMAREAGLNMPETHLFPSHVGKGYFAVKRFDRIKQKRIHMHTASGLLHNDFRVPSLDYEDLFNLTTALTKNIREVEQLFRLAVFNVLAHNRDDHGKNFSYLMDETGAWRLSPAYDLTFSNGPNGEQSCMVLGEGKNPGLEDLTKLGLVFGIDRGTIASIFDQTIYALKQWQVYADEFKVSKQMRNLIHKRIGQK